MKKAVGGHFLFRLQYNCPVFPNDAEWCHLELSYGRLPSIWLRGVYFDPIGTIRTPAYRLLKKPASLSGGFLVASLLPQSPHSFTASTVMLRRLFLTRSAQNLKFASTKKGGRNMSSVLLTYLSSNQLQFKSGEATEELAQALCENWGHLIPIKSSFESDLFWYLWTTRSDRQIESDYESILVSSLLAKYADNIFPNVRKLLKLFAFLPMGSLEIHTWLCNTMTTEWLSDLAVITMHANTVTINRNVVCKKFVVLHPRQMTASSFFVEEVIKVFLLALFLLLCGVSKFCSLYAVSNREEKCDIMLP